MGRKLKNILEGTKKGRERWAKEREGWKKDKEDEVKERETIDVERRKLEEKTKEDKESWEETYDRAQRRIVELEDENARLSNEAAEKEKLETKREAARKALEESRAEEQKRLEEDVQAKANRATSKLEEEVLNGRKLIEDLQSDKRRDRQLLLELRAQLVRPTHAVPPCHMNPLRFGGSAQAIYGAPIIATSPVAPSTNSLVSPKGTLPTILPSDPPQATHTTLPSPDSVNQDVDWPPIVRLPPPPPPRGQLIPTQIPAGISPPPNAPKGPKGWKPSPSGKA